MGSPTTPIMRATTWRDRLRNLKAAILQGRFSDAGGEAGDIAEEFFLGKIEPLARAGEEFETEVTSGDPGRSFESLPGFLLGQEFGMARPASDEARQERAFLRGMVGGGTRAASELPSPGDVATLGMAGTASLLAKAPKTASTALKAARALDLAASGTAALSGAADIADDRPLEGIAKVGLGGLGLLPPSILNADISTPVVNAVKEHIANSSEIGAVGDLSDLVRAEQIRKGRLEPESMVEPESAIEPDDINDELARAMDDELMAAETTEPPPPTRQLDDAWRAEVEAALAKQSEPDVEVEPLRLADQDPDTLMVKKQALESQTPTAKTEGELSSLEDDIEAVGDEIASRVGARTAVPPVSPPTLAGAPPVNRSTPPGNRSPGGPGPGSPTGPPAPPSRPPTPPQRHWKDMPAHDREDWINARAAAPIRSAKVGGEVRTALAQNRVPDDVAVVERNWNQLGPARDSIKAYTDEAYARVTDAGGHLRYRRDYKLPQYWENGDDQVRQAARRLGLKPGFFLERAFPDYQTGIAAGLTPKFKTVSETLAHYERSVSKYIADQKFFNWLRKARAISVRPVPGFEPLNPEVFPVNRFLTPTGERRSNVFYAHPDAKRAIEDYLVDESSEALKFVAGKIGDTKNVAMSGGIPGSAVSGHGASLAGRSFLTQGPGFAIDFTKKMLRPRHAVQKFEQSFPDMIRGVEHGMTLSVEEYGSKVGTADLNQPLKRRAWQELVKGKEGKTPASFTDWAKENFGVEGEFGYKKLRALHQVLFEDPLFQMVVPYAKTRAFTIGEKYLIKQGYDPEDAARLSAAWANEAFGGVNWDVRGTRRSDRNMIRLFLNAPDWAMTQYLNMKRLVKAAKEPKALVHDLFADITGGKAMRPGNRQARNIIRNLMLYYVAGNVIAKGVTGKWMWEQQPGQKMTVPAGVQKDETLSGKHRKTLRQARPLGTGADFVKVPIDVIDAMINGDLGGVFRALSARYSLPMAALTRLASQRDFRGRRTLGRGVPVERQLGSIGRELVELGAPPYARAAADYVSGQVTPEEALVKSMELPISYPKVSKDDKPSSSGPTIVIPRPKIPRVTRPR